MSFLRDCPQLLCLAVDSPNPGSTEIRTFCPRPFLNRKDENKGLQEQVLKKETWDRSLHIEDPRKDECLQVLNPDTRPSSGLSQLTNSRALGEWRRQLYTWPGECGVYTTFPCLGLAEHKMRVPATSQPWSLQAGSVAWGQALRGSHINDTDKNDHHITREMVLLDRKREYNISVHLISSIKISIWMK